MPGNANRQDQASRRTWKWSPAADLAAFITPRSALAMCSNSRRRRSDAGALPRRPDGRSRIEVWVRVCRASRARRGALAASPLPGPGRSGPPGHGLAGAAGRRCPPQPAPPSPLAGRQPGEGDADHERSSLAAGSPVQPTDEPAGPSVTVLLVWSVQESRPMRFARSPGFVRFQACRRG